MLFAGFAKRKVLVDAESLHAFKASLQALIYTASLDVFKVLKIILDTFPVDSFCVECSLPDDHWPPFTFISDAYFLDFLILPFILSDVYAKPTGYRIWFVTFLTYSWSM